MCYYDTRSNPIDQSLSMVIVVALLSPMLDIEYVKKRLDDPHRCTFSRSKPTPWTFYRERRGEARGGVRLAARYY